jgi:hypothetical protein
MTTFAHENPVAVPDAQPDAVPEPRRGLSGLLTRETWAGLAIVVIWLAVLFSAVFGGDIVTSDAGGSSAVVPSAIVVALFASLATAAVAKHGFGRRAT